METKARLGLFAGGLVLVGMVAYVMMPRSAGPKADDASVTQNSPDSPDYAAAPSTQPTTQPIAITDPFAAPAPAPGSTSATPDLTAQPGVASAGQPAPALADAAQPAAKSNDVWDHLDRGWNQDRAGGSLTAHSSLLSQASAQTPTLSEPVARSAGAGESSAAKTYKVEAGDSLYTISMKVFGNAKYTNKILAANPGVNAKRLRVGQELKLPDIADTQAPAVVHSAAASHAESAAPALASMTGEKTYKVQAGDSLMKISSKLYGKTSLWKQIYAANKGKIGSDPTRLRAGMVLQLPANVQ